MEKCRAYCTKEFVNREERDLHEIEDHGAEAVVFNLSDGTSTDSLTNVQAHIVDQFSPPTGESPEAKCPGPDQCYAADKGVDHHHDSLLGVVHVHDGPIPVKRPEGVMFGDPGPVEIKLTKVMRALHRREMLAFGGETVVDQLLTWCEMLDEVLDKQRQELSGTDKAVSRLNDRISSVEEYIRKLDMEAQTSAAEAADPEHEHTILVLHQAEARVREYMTGHFWKGTIEGVIAAVRGESGL